MSNVIRTSVSFIAGLRRAAALEPASLRNVGLPARTPLAGTHRGTQAAASSRIWYGWLTQPCGFGSNHAA